MSKLILRILNFVIMTISVAAIVFLFAAPAFSFNSNIAIDVATFSEFVPENELIENFDAVHILGTDEIQFSIQFELNASGISKTAKGERDIINNEVISKNISGILDELRTPVKLITDSAIKGAIKKIVKQEITKQVDAAREQFKEKYPDREIYSTEEIMDEVGMDEAYFKRFAKNLYDAADKVDATAQSVTDVLFAQIDEALTKAEETGMVDTSSFADDTKNQIKDSLISSLDSLGLVGEGGKIERISEVSYIYLSKYLKEKLDGSISASELDRQTDESNPDYSDRMLRLFVLNKMPDAFYTGIGVVSTGLLIGLFVFTAIWGFVLIITLIKTFTKKPWTFFGPWFWILGPLQLVLGLGLTVAGKFILPDALGKLPIDLSALPIKSVVLAPRTYALAPSILFIIIIFVGIVYAVFKGMAKREMKEEVIMK